MQPLLPGSYVKVEDADGALSPDGDFTVQMWIRPTMPENPSQTLISRRGPDSTGYALRLEGGKLTLELGHERLVGEQKVHPNVWYFVAAIYDASAQVARLLLHQCSGVIVDQPGVVTGSLRRTTVRGSGGS